MIPEELRTRMAEEARGKVVESLEWVDDQPNGYWVMTFVGGTEFAFRFMGEIHDVLPPGV